MIWILLGVLTLLAWLGFGNLFAIEPETEGMFYDAIFMLD